VRVGRRRADRRHDAELSRPVRRVGDRHPGRRLRRLRARLPAGSV